MQDPDEQDAPDTDAEERDSTPLPRLSEPREDGVPARLYRLGAGLTVTDVIRIFAVELAFLVGYFLIAAHVHANGSIPVWVADVFLAAVALDLWALALKRRAVLHLLGESTRVLPASLFVMVFFAIVRTGIFSVMTVTALQALGWIAPGDDAALHVVIGIVALKEIAVLALLARPPTARAMSRRRTSRLLELLADLVLALSAIVALVFLDRLLDKPMLDRSWNPLIFVGMTLLVCVIYLLFTVPFRVLYTFESLKGPSWSMAVEVGSLVIVLGRLLWFLTYSSTDASARFQAAVAHMSSPSELRFEERTRLRPDAWEPLCARGALGKLTLHTEWVDYVPPCVLGLSGLSELDLADNDLIVFSLEGAKALTRADLSGNAIRSLGELDACALGGPRALEYLDLAHNRIDTLSSDLAHCTALRFLDLSHNPLKTVTLEHGALPKLETLRIEATPLPEHEVQRLRRLLPGAKVVGP